MLARNSAEKRFAHPWHIFERNKSERVNKTRFSKYNLNDGHHLNSCALKISKMNPTQSLLKNARIVYEPQVCVELVLGNRLDAKSDEIRIFVKRGYGGQSFLYAEQLQ